MSKKVGNCFTGEFKGLARVLYSPVNIENALDKTKKENGKALWDTGATGSLITQAMAKKLGLLPISKAPITTPSGSKLSDVYLVNLYLPNKVVIPEMKVLSGIPSNCDMLIGMDIIGLGDFAVSNYAGETSFSFRIPSYGKIDFCKDGYLKPIIKDNKIGRNDPCPCGSGKKYKKCCGQ